MRNLCIINGQYSACLKILEDLYILPNEGARSGHDTYRNANIKLALDYYKKEKYKNSIKQIGNARLWPENLGVGRPHICDERIEDYLQLLCNRKQGKLSKAEELKKQIIAYTLRSLESKGRRKNASTLLGALTLKEDGQLKEADRLMKIWLDSNSGDNIAKWAMAVYSGDEARAQKLSENIKRAGKGTPWNPVSYDASFELVKEISSLINE